MAAGRSTIGTTSMMQARWARASPRRSTCCSGAGPTRSSPRYWPYHGGRDRRPVQRRHQICRHLLGRAARLEEQRRRCDGDVPAAVARLKEGDGPRSADPGQRVLVQSPARGRAGRRARPAGLPGAARRAARRCSARTRSPPPSSWLEPDLHDRRDHRPLRRPRARSRPARSRPEEPSEAELARREKMKQEELA